MPVDCAPLFEGQEALAELAPTPHIRGLQGSAILKIAGEVRALKATGAEVANFTIGDFDPSQFPVPASLVEGIKRQLDARQTHYPPAVGLPELRQAVRTLYRDKLGLDYPAGCVQVGSGARPPLFAAFHSLVAPGDVVLYPVPTWNIRYYVYLTQGQGVPLVTRPELGFMPTAADLAPHLESARLLVLNSPLNPCGTAIAEELLREICQAIVAENVRRAPLGERPLMLIYDQVYWQLTFEGTEHFTPVGLVPEMARYTIFIDAISKSWAATGLRVGWAVAPPWVRARMQPFLGHAGAWAARPEQLSTAALMGRPDEIASFLSGFKAGLHARLTRLHQGLQALKAEGLPIDSMAPQGAIYLSARIPLIGHSLDGVAIDSDESMRAALLQHAQIAVVPFTAFGYPENTGWVRLSVGSVSLDDIDAALVRLRQLLLRVR